MCWIHMPEVETRRLLAEARCSGFYETAPSSLMHLLSLLLRHPVVRGTCAEARSLVPVPLKSRETSGRFPSRDQHVELA